jgi:hypothetical protein
MSRSRRAGLIGRAFYEFAGLNELVKRIPHHPRGRANCRETSWIMGKSALSVYHDRCTRGGIQ